MWKMGKLIEKQYFEKNKNMEGCFTLVNKINVSEKKVFRFNKFYINMFNRFYINFI